MAPSWAITGRSAHAAEEANYKQKLDTFTDISLNDARDIAASEFDKALNDATDEVIWDKGETAGAAKDRTILGVDTYHRRVAPLVQPVLVEEKVDLTLPWGTRFTGRMDVVDASTAIRDTKHVAYAPGDGDDLFQTQPGLYGWAYRELTGELPKFKFDYVVLGRKDAAHPKPYTKEVETPVTQERVQTALDRVQRIERAIRAGNVYPVANVFNCRGCGYRKICQFAASK